MKPSQVTILVLGWRIVLTLVTAIAIVIIPFKPSFPYADTILNPLGPRLLTSWANFDGVHYLTIIEKGYRGTGVIQAFFPLYPLVVKVITPIVSNPILAGISLSTGALLAALIWLDKLIRLDEPKTIAKKTIFLILLSPTAFFFTSLYTESLFLLLTILCFYSARTRRWLLAGVLGACASASRLVGIFLVPALLVELWLQQKKKFSLRANLQKIIGSLLPALGTGAYMWYLKRVFNDPFLFLNVQPQFGVEREVDRLILLYQVFWRYTKMVVTVTKNSWLFYNVLLELIIAMVFLALLLSAFKKTRQSYAVFAILAFVAPTLTGTFTSLPRYVLVLFPAFIVLAKTTRPVLYRLILTISAILLMVNTILFFQGYWVA